MSHGYGNHANSDFSLKLWNNSSFRVVFNNNTFNKSNQFGLQNIKPGYHNLQVIKLVRNKHGHGFLKKVLYSGNIKIPKNSKVKAIVTRHRNLQISIVKKNNHNFHGHQQNCGHQNGYSCGCSVNNDDWNEPYGYNDGYFNTPQQMSQYEFNQLYTLLDNTSFDNSKLTIAKQAIRSNYFTTNQVSILMSLFSFDSKRVQLAKLAYAKVVDKHNYYMVNEQFTFNSTVEELHEYINKYG